VGADGAGAAHLAHVDGWPDAEMSQSVTTALDVSSPPVEVGIVGGPPGAPVGLADGSA
jgi:hypothetical protein